ncbi:MAG: hypothetical protein U0271_47330 [Polyangiaceae bacterium]
MRSTKLLSLAFVLLAACADDTETSTTSSSSSSTSTGPQPEPTWLDDPESALPATLSETGIYDDVIKRTPSDALTTYAPRFPLYSDGLDKDRLVRVPTDAVVSTSAAGLAFDFPPGTVFVKTFTWQGEAVETRLLILRDVGWDYAVYLWRADGTDADLLVGNWAEVPLTLAGGAEHTVPARLDCRTCHETFEAQAGSPVLGISPLQMTAALADTGWFASPPPPIELGGRTPEEDAALGYFVGNCVACHNGGTSTNASFSLLPEDAVANTVDVPVEGDTGEGIRVVPHDPAASALFISVVLAREPDYTGSFKPMPPIGLSRVDPGAESILSNWIEGLP